MPCIEAHVSTSSSVFDLESDHDHTITVVLVLQLPLGSTDKEYEKAIGAQPKVWKWWQAEHLEKGKTYRIGTDRGSTIKEWFEGSTEELLRKPLAERTDDKMNKEPIVINVTQPAEFTMKRPDADGSLNWP
ncbi:hypothetical protein ACKRZS_013874 [Fusarium odoratissimum]